MIQVAQGKQAVSADEEAVMTTVLGSCVAACLFDPVAGVGGMNHFLLPEGNAHGSRHIVYGAQAMELLINGLMKLGGRKDRMQAKLFGGARVVDGLSDIGDANATFAIHFMKEEGIPCVAKSLGGTQARRVRFWPVSGRANQKQFAQTALVQRNEVPVKAVAPDVTLF